MAYRTKTDTKRLRDLNSEFTKRYKAGDMLQTVDTRTALGKAIRDTRIALVEHVGGAPSVPQQMLIDEVAFCTVVVGILRNFFLGKAVSDGKVIPNRQITDLYRTWSAILHRDLNDLGLKKRGIDGDASYLDIVHRTKQS